MADKYYGTGTHVTNPFFPTENTYEGSGHTMISPHGTAFDYEIDSTNEMDRRLGKSSGKLPGKFVKNSQVMGK